MIRCTTMTRIGWVAFTSLAGCLLTACVGDAVPGGATGGAAGQRGSGTAGQPATGARPGAGAQSAVGAQPATGAQPGTAGESATGGRDGIGGSEPTAGVSTEGSGGSGLAVTAGAPSTGGQPATGGRMGDGGSPPATGGAEQAGGAPETGGTPGGAGGTVTGGTAGAGGVTTGGVTTGGASTGGLATGGVSTGGLATGGVSTGGAVTGGSAGAGGACTETCTPSQATDEHVNGSGPHQVVIETNSDPGIRCGTIYRPADLGGGEKYPILVWGEEGCAQDGLSNQAALGEIASWGYFVVADGTPDGLYSCVGGDDGEALLNYVTWAIAQNDNCCSAYHQSLDTTNIAADGFSCGGLMAENVSSDPRFAAIGITSSGLFEVDEELYDGIHTPFKIMNGGPSDVAYDNGLRDYEQISSRGIPIVYFSETSAGHGGDLLDGQGDFNLVNLAWLNWQLKGDEGVTGKGFLYGSTCEFCSDPGWDYKSANIE